ncbi:hypothetical protein D9758_007519 [Tetrapyrgos nigripes]|uniref:Cyclin-like domain-containing protein n=1 Tax=Tetrapyrgos nigripes TaxID=182062 RepID=A0A8H5G3N6_9AGAR|nr:hypothetical protein D9758_007519 [Tetrapyrgos nigripes]
MSYQHSVRDRRHPQSLLPIRCHNPHLVHLMTQRVSHAMIDYIASQTTKVVRIDDESSSSEAGAIMGLKEFIVQLVKACHVHVSTLLTTLIYLDRLRSRLPTLAKGVPTTRHRVFLATLIVSAKYLNDSTPKNIHWAKYAAIFPLNEINLMEAQLLSMLAFDLRFDEEEACKAFGHFMSNSTQIANTRALAVDKVTKAGRARAQAQDQERTTSSSSDAPLSLLSVHRVPSSNSLASTIRGLTKRLSNAHLSSRTSELALPPMSSTLSTASATSTSSDIGSLVDDTGSSSGSSSGWTSSSDSESDTDTEDRFVPRVYSSSLSVNKYFPQEPSQDSALLDATGKHLVACPMPSYTHRNQQIRERSRKPSDSSSILTVTTHSPVSSSHVRKCSSKRSFSIMTSSSASKESSMVTSATMPNIPRASISGNFLSRMWGAAKIQALGQDKSGNDYAPYGLRRLVLVQGKSDASQGSTLDLERGR